VGVGRTGSMLAPIIAGYLFRGGYSLQFVAIAMSGGSLVAAAAVWLLPPRPQVDRDRTGDRAAGRSGGMNLEAE